MIELKGMAWDHPRGYEPLIAASQEFMKSNPDVDIKWDVRSLKEFGDMPIERLIERYDLITIDHPYMGQADENGLLLKLEEHLTNDVLAKLEKQSLGRCIDIYHYNKHVYALPIDAAALVAAYRKDKIEEMGLRLPKTRDELKSFYGKIPNGYAVAWALCPTDMWCTFLSLCVQNVGSGFIRNRQIDARVGSSVLDEIKFHLDFLHPDSLRWNPIDILDQMSARDEMIYAPYLFGYTNYAREGYAKKLVHFANSPVGTQKNISTIMGGVGIAVSALTKNPFLAAQFAGYVAGAEIQSGVYTLNGGQPGNKLAWLNAANDKLCSNFFRNTILSIENAYIRPQHPGWNEYQEQGADIIHEGILQDTGTEIIMRQLNELYRSV